MTDLDIETDIARSLHDRAAPVRPSSALHDAALARAGHLRRRRIATGGAGVVTLAAAVAAGVIATAGGGLALGGKVGPASIAAEAPAEANLPTSLPGLPAAPVAGRQPTAVGTDPGVLHFDVDLATILGATKADAATWASGPGYERFSVAWAQQRPGVEVYLGADAAKLQAAIDPAGSYVLDDKGNRTPLYTVEPAPATAVAGRPATLEKVVPTNDVPKGVHGDVPQNTRAWTKPAWVLRWQPVDGLTAVVQVRDGDVDLARLMAGALRLDRAQRCPVPWQITTAPAGSVWKSCETTVLRAPTAPLGVWHSSHITFTTPQGTTAHVYSQVSTRQPEEYDLRNFRADHMINGAAAQWMEPETISPGGLWVPKIGQLELTVSGVAEADAVHLAEGLALRGDAGDPSTWPMRPVG